jgi:hypothetical protein
MGEDRGRLRGKTTVIAGALGEALGPMGARSAAGFVAVLYPHPHHHRTPAVLDRSTAHGRSTSTLDRCGSRTVCRAPDLCQGKCALR